MTQEQLIEELARVIANSFAMQPGYSDFTKVARAILPIHTRDTLAAYQRGLRDAAAICDEVNGGLSADAGYAARTAAKRIRERLT